MPRTESSLDALNRLLAIQYRSLPQYLLWACPYRRAEDDRAWSVIQHVVEDQQALSARVVELIEDRQARVDYGDFPLTFTGTHDLSLDYLVRRLIEWQQGTVQAIEQVVAKLGRDPVGQSLAEECLGAAKGHLENLRELLTPAAPAETIKLADAATAVPVDQH